MTQKEGTLEDLTRADRLEIMGAGGMEYLMEYHCLPKNKELSLHWMTEEYEP